MNISSAFEAAAERPADRWSEAVRGQVLTAEAALTTGEAAAMTGNTPLATAEMAEEMAAALTNRKKMIDFKFEHRLYLWFSHISKGSSDLKQIYAQEREPFSSLLLSPVTWWCHLFSCC